MPLHSHLAAPNTPPKVLIPYVAGTSLLALACLLIDMRGLADVGLRSTRTPGLYLLSVISVLALLGLLKGLSARDTALTYICLAGPLFEEFWPARRYVKICLGVLLVLVGCCYAVRNRGAGLIWTIGNFVTAAYIQSVFLYDLCVPNQMMNFFRGGWSA
jgi:hypothetical protein